MSVLRLRHTTKGRKQRNTKRCRLQDQDRRGASILPVPHGTVLWAFGLSETPRDSSGRWRSRPDRRRNPIVLGRSIFLGRDQVSWIWRLWRNVWGLSRQSDERIESWRWGHGLESDSGFRSLMVCGERFALTSRPGWMTFAAHIRPCD